MGKASLEQRISGVLNGDDGDWKMIANLINET